MFLPDLRVSMLSEHVRTIGVRPDGWLFAGTGDGPPHKRIRCPDWWRKTLDRRGPNPGAHRLHDLRHFYASGLISEGLRRGDRAAGARALRRQQPR